MDFDLQWLLLGLPVAFAFGWLASRFDVRQWKREQNDSPKAYYQGLNLLLNEQHDKAIDAFIEAVQHDPDTSDLHFALGNLFRRRGEYERAVRVHEHLLQRADLPPAERDRAPARAGPGLHEGRPVRPPPSRRSPRWTARCSTPRRAWRCWRCTNARASGAPPPRWRPSSSAAAVGRSRRASPTTGVSSHWKPMRASRPPRPTKRSSAPARWRRSRPRPLILAGQRARARGDHRSALQEWGTLLAAHPAAFNLVAIDYAESAKALGEPAAAMERLETLYRRTPTTDLLAAIGRIDADPQRQRQRVLSHLQHQPALSAAQTLLQLSAGTTLSDDESKALRDGVARAAKPLQRYRCAACAFEAQNYFWQCPGCLGWDTYPPQRQEDL